MSNLHIYRYYVIGYEERMELMRAAILGLRGTPYHVGLFFFDIFFPPDYPHELPVITFMTLVSALLSVFA
ncbi:hypothetical protein GW17_00054037 [Ensete ventricosum]|nr:hypothetical protein GW17_00054037 [Ensete ventricosum]